MLGSLFIYTNHIFSETSFNDIIEIHPSLISNQKTCVQILKLSENKN